MNINFVVNQKILPAGDFLQQNTKQHMEIALFRPRNRRKLAIRYLDARIEPSVKSGTQWPLTFAKQV
jgi:hypothetical protein